jgi:hypothetical protein
MNSCYADTQILARKAYGAKKIPYPSGCLPCRLSKIEREREAPMRALVAFGATNTQMGEAIASGQESLSLRDFGYLRNMSDQLL